jgi:hypothetical protein
MEISRLLGLAAGLIMIASMIPYISSIVKGQTHPHLFTWVIWAVVTAIGFTAQTVEGAGAGAWIMVVNCLLCLTVVVLALRHGERNITRFDWVVFIAALAAIPVWVLTKNPFWAVLMVSAIDGTGLVPTWRKTWGRPYSENLTPYVCTLAAFFLSVAALERFSFTTAFYPCSIMATHIAFLMMVLLRRRAISV